jgi:hypothetical protein
MSYFEEMRNVEKARNVESAQCRRKRAMFEKRAMSDLRNFDCNFDRCSQGKKGKVQH